MSSLYKHRIISGVGSECFFG